MALAQLVKRDVHAKPRTELNLDPHANDGVDLGLDDGAIQPVFGNPQHHHSAEDLGGFVDGDLIPMKPQIVGGSKTSWATSDDTDRLLLLGTIHRHHGGLIGAGLRTELLGDETLQSPNGDRLVDIAPTTGIFTRSGADPPTHRRKRVWHPRCQVGGLVIALSDRRDIGTGVGVHWASSHARDVLVVVGELDRNRHVR